MSLDILNIDESSILLINTKFYTFYIYKVFTDDARLFNYDYANYGHFHNYGNPWMPDTILC